MFLVKVTCVIFVSFMWCGQWRLWVLLSGLWIVACSERSQNDGSELDEFFHTALEALDSATVAMAHGHRRPSLLSFVLVGVESKSVGTLSVNVVASIQLLGSVLRLGRVCWLEFSFFQVLSTDRFECGRIRCL